MSRPLMLTFSQWKTLVGHDPFKNRYDYYAEYGRYCNKFRKEHGIVLIK